MKEKRIYNCFNCFVLIILQLLVSLNGYSKSININSDTTKDQSQITLAKSNDQNDMFCKKLSDKYIVLHNILLDEFIKEINKYGGCGYRTHLVSRYMIPLNQTEKQMKFYAVLLRNAPEKYEYAWFFAYSPGEAQTIANKYAQQSFYFLTKLSFMSGVNFNAPSDTKDSSLEKLGQSLGISVAIQRGAFFLFERRVGSTIKKEYKILDGRVTGKKNEMAENNKKLNDYAAKGFRPLDLWYTGFTTQNLVIVEKDELIKPESEYLMIYQTQGLNKKLTELGREGFEPISIGYVFALLKRRNKEPINYMYDSIQTWQDIEKRIPEWKQSGLEFIDTGISDYYTNYDPFDGRWLLAIPQKNNVNYAKNKNFVLLRYNSFVEDYINKSGLKTSQKKSLTEKQIQEINDSFSIKINQLAKEGYQLVNYGYPNSIVALLIK